MSNCAAPAGTGIDVVHATCPLGVWQTFMATVPPLDEELAVDEELAPPEPVMPPEPVAPPEPVMPPLVVLELLAPPVPLDVAPPALPLDEVLLEAVAGAPPAADPPDPPLTDPPHAARSALRAMATPDQRSRRLPG
ncbi:MAG: hypothetical protein QM820_19415 [Minicystis sp.]